MAERIHEVLPGVLHWPARYPTAGAGSAWARRSAPRGTGMHELPADRVQPYDFRDVLSVGIRPHAISATSPDETARDPLIPAVAIADGVINSDGLGFLADFLLGDDHDAENQRLRDGFARLAAEVDFDHLLLAHGPPIVGDGRERLRAFAAALNAAQRADHDRNHRRDARFSLPNTRPSAQIVGISPMPPAGPYS